MARDMQVIWGKVEADYFSHEGWTGQISLIRHDKSGCARIEKNAHIYALNTLAAPFDPNRPTKPIQGAAVAAIHVRWRTSSLYENQSDM